MKEKSFVRGRNMAGIQVKKCASVHCRAILQCALEEQHRRKIDLIIQPYREEILAKLITVYK